MKTVIAGVVAGLLGVVVGALGWALIGPDDDDSEPPTAGKPAAATSYTSAQDIADALEAGGLTVSMVHKSTEETYITEVGGTSWDLAVSDQAGKPAAGDSAIHMFPNAEAVESWVEISKGFGGVAVTGDTWAVSLPSGDDAKTDSLRLAPKVADILGGTVQK